MHINVTTKFNPGDKVFTVDYDEKVVQAEVLNVNVYAREEGIQVMYDITVDGTVRRIDVPEYMLMAEYWSYT